MKDRKDYIKGLVEQTFSNQELTSDEKIDHFESTMEHLGNILNLSDEEIKYYHKRLSKDDRTPQYVREVTKEALEAIEQIQILINSVKEGND